MNIVYITVGFLAFFVATTLAIDVGLLTTARAQAQNAADAGALSGAIALALDSFDDRSPGGPAVQSAVNAAHENLVIGAGVSVEPADVSFPEGPDGEANRVHLTVYRSAARSNPLGTFISAVFGVTTVDVTAAATAEAAPANAMTCVKPFTIPDRWVENSDPPWTVDSTFDRYDKKGKLIPDADVYIPRGEAGYNGYDPFEDRGLELMIRAGAGNNVVPSFYWSWSMPGGSGADWYRENISGCNDYLAHLDELMTAEPGNMVGPTTQGIDDLLAQDPEAYWDEVTESVKSPLGRSPRVFPIPLYDPEHYASGKTNGRNADLRMASWIGFFVERRQGNNVYGRITPILGTIDRDAGPAPEGTFPRAVRLVE